MKPSPLPAPTSSKLPVKYDPEYLQANRAYLTDVDGDGDRDLVLASNSRLTSPASGVASTDSALRVLANDGAGAFAAVASATLPAASGEDSLQADGVAIGDLSGDGKTDFVLVSYRAPVGQALVGRRVGDIVEVALGDETARIEVLSAETRLP